MLMTATHIKLALVTAGLLLGGAAAWSVMRDTPRPPIPGPAGDHAQHAARGGASMYEGIYRESEDAELRFELKPGANGVVSSAGFMDREYDLSKPAGGFRTVGLGDSVTMYFSIEGDSYLSRLEAALARDHPGAEVLNLGVGGYDTIQAVRLLELRGLAYGPDVVTLGWVVNDSVEFSELITDLTGAPAGVAVNDDSAATQSRARAAAAALGWQATYDQHIARSRRATDCQWALGKLARLATEHGFDVVVVMFPALAQLDDYWLAPVHEAVATSARAKGFAIVDLTAAFRRAGPEGLRALASDVIHPNAEGNRIAFEALAAWFAKERPWDG